MSSSAHRARPSTGDSPGTGLAGDRPRAQIIRAVESHQPRSMGRLPGGDEQATIRGHRGAHGATVLRVCRAVLGPTAAEDAWSETFLAALRAYPELRADSNVEGWLVTIAHRKAIDHLRAAIRRAADPRGRTARPVRPACRSGPDRRRAGLPPRQRQTVAYHYLAGLPYADVAPVLGGTPDAARRAAADGIAALRRAYDSPPEGTPMSTPADPPRHLCAGLPRYTRRPAPAPRAPRRRRRGDGSWTSPTAPSTPRWARCSSPQPRRGWSGWPTRRGPRHRPAAGRPGQPARAARPRPPGRGRPGAGGVLRRPRQAFDLPLDLRLSEGFRRRPRSPAPDRVRADRQLLRRRALRQPRAVRAVGSACATNPLPVVVPCHRVVHRDGSIGQYVGGVDAKRTLLTLEDVA